MASTSRAPWVFGYLGVGLTEEQTKERRDAVRLWFGRKKMAHKGFVFQGCYADKSEPGEVMRRMQPIRMRKQALFVLTNAGRGDVIVFSALDCFKSIPDFARTLKVLWKRGTRVVLPAIWLDTKTKYGRRLAAAIGDLSAFFSSYSGRNDRSNTGAAPYPFRKENKQLVCWPERRALGVKAVEMANAGKHWEEIAEEMKLTIMQVDRLIKQERLFSSGKYPERLRLWNEKLEGK